MKAKLGSSLSAIAAITLALLYQSGALALYHRLVNRRALTTVMFHRVLPKDDPRWATADPVYTVTLDFFVETLAFFAKHYSVIDIVDVLASVNSGKALPQRPLLITFDDGWSDTKEFAFPALVKARMPAVVFVPSEPILSSQPIWWVDIAARVWSRGLVGHPQLSDSFADAAEIARRRAAGTKVPELLWFLAEVGKWDERRRESAIARITPLLGDEPGRQLLTREELRQLESGGVRTGAHGHQHVALPCLDNPRDDLDSARSALADLLKGLPSPGLSTLAIPHGYYDQRSLTAALANFELVFTSDRLLTPLADSRLGSRVLGRVNIGQYAMQPNSLRLNPMRLANWLFTCSQQVIAAPASAS